MLAVTAITARSVALAGFGVDSLIEIGASIVVVWELSGSGTLRRDRALRLIGIAFGLLAVYLAVQSSLALATGFRPGHSLGGVVWTGLTAVAMFALAAGKARTGTGYSSTGGRGHAGRRAAGRHRRRRRHPSRRGRRARPGPARVARHRHGPRRHDGAVARRQAWHCSPPHQAAHIPAGSPSAPVEGPDPHPSHPRRPLRPAGDGFDRPTPAGRRT
ncbi:hypothetical protein GCM10027360_56950 [Amycolatopsis echigonensis]|uniref:hypothetical protein n=1 Tax=Amycolatopsis echigonensis TaxID=2576905 RepID=UPI001ABFA999|nr:hypothetical protein [Amycolatopsis niigatensis]